MQSKLTEVFDGIYSRGVWGRDAKGRGISGPGSTLLATAEYRLFLEEFIRLVGIQSVVDAGCGDCGFSYQIDWGAAKYSGFDVSAEAIEIAKTRYYGENISLAVASLVEPLPPADLLLCKDALQHLPNQMIQQFITNNLCLGKYKWAIITNDKGQENKDIAPGGHHYLDLSLPPFNVRGLVDLPIQFFVFGNKTAQLIYLE